MAGREKKVASEIGILNAIRVAMSLPTLGPEMSKYGHPTGLWDFLEASQGTCHGCRFCSQSNALKSHSPSQVEGRRDGHEALCCMLSRDVAGSAFDLSSSDGPQLVDTTIGAVSLLAQLAAEQARLAAQQAGLAAEQTDLVAELKGAQPLEYLKVVQGEGGGT
jgi:hypothetical protein